MTITNKNRRHEIKMISSVLITKENKYVVIRRSLKNKKHGGGMVHSFGGHIDHGENPLEAAIREVKEEVGVEIENVKLRAVVTEIKCDDKELPDWVIFHFTAEYASGDYIQTEEGDLLELSKEELLKQKMLPSFQIVLNHLLTNKDDILTTTFHYNKGEFIDEEKRISYC